MRIALVASSVGLMVFLLWGGRPVISASGSIENRVTSKIGYVADGAASKCTTTSKALGESLKIGALVKDALPLQDVEAIEIFGDSLRLPGAIVTRALCSGKVVKCDPRAYGQAIVGCVRFKGGNALPMTFFPNAGQLFSQIKLGESWLEMPAVPAPGADGCLKSLADLKPGTSTRKDLQKHFYPDGGITAPFRGERFVFQGYKSDAGVLKVNAAFRPKSVTESAYNAQELFENKASNHSNPKQSPDDVLMKLSPVYLEQAFFD